MSDTNTLVDPYLGFNWTEYADAPLDIGVDVDDVLFPWYDMVHEACCKAGISGGVTPITYAPYDEYGISREEWLDVVNPLVINGAYLKQPPVQGSAEAMRRLHWAGHRVHVITARGFFEYGELLRIHTKRWLHEWAIPFDSLTFTQDKAPVATELGITRFLDDHLKNYYALRWDADIPCRLLTKPWNQDEAIPLEHRVATVDDFVNDILGGMA